MRFWVAGLIVLVGLWGHVVHAETAGPVGVPKGPWREQIYWVPMEDASGRPRLLYTRICRPRTDQPARVVLIDHGKPPSADVPKVKPASCTNEAVQWFLARGYVVVLQAFAGDMGRRVATCWRARGRAVPTIWSERRMKGARGRRMRLCCALCPLALPFVRPDGVVVVGQSVGGWVSDGYNSLPHPHVAAMVSMAGGHGGHLHDVANLNCRPDQLIAAAGVLGKTATTPMLWVYTENDSYFAPALAKSMYEAFAAAGGKADFRPLPPFAKDGHSRCFSDPADRRSGDR